MLSRSFAACKSEDDGFPFLIGTSSQIRLDTMGKVLEPQLSFYCVFFFFFALSIGVISCACVNIAGTRSEGKSQ